MRQLINSILLTLLMSMVGAKAFAYDIAVKNADGVTIYYNYINDGKELEVAPKMITLYYFPEYDKNAYSGDVVIPDEVIFMNRSRKVTRIGNNAFCECRNLKSVSIPNSVVTIGSSAFWNCYGLESVTIPPSVKTIKNGAFGCENPTSWLRDAFKKVIVHDIAAWCQIQFEDEQSNPLRIAEHLYVDEHEIFELEIPDGVTSIKNRAFSGCRHVISITIPNSVTSIGESAFSGCSALDFINIPNSVTSIGEWAFEGCSGLTSVTISHRVTSICNYTFKDCTGLTSITIPNSVTSIGHDAFVNCSSLTSITIPNSVTDFGSYAFWKCSGLTSVSICDGVKSIGPNAFTGCSSLNSLYIGKSVITIGDYAFTGSNILTIISRIKNPFKIYNIFNKNTLNNATLYVPIGTINQYKNTEGWKDFLFIEEGTGPDDLTPNDNPAQSGSCGLNLNFSYQDATQALTISGSGEMTEYNLDNKAPWSSYASEIQTVEFELGITSIGDFAFYKCKGMTDIDIPVTVSSIGSSSFEGCFSLTSLTLHEGVELIKGSAFESCIKLKTITLPSTVKTILTDAFRNCESITDVYCYAEDVPNTAQDVFEVTPTEKATLHVHESAIEAYREAWPWSYFKEIVAIEENPDGIMSVRQSEDINGDYYDLTGRKAKQLRKGFYIKNGKKVVIK